MLRALGFAFSFVVIPAKRGAEPGPTRLQSDQKSKEEVRVISCARRQASEHRVSHRSPGVTKEGVIAAGPGLRLFVHRHPGRSEAQSRDRGGTDSSLFRLPIGTPGLTGPGSHGVRPGRRWKVVGTVFNRKKGRKNRPLTSSVQILNPDQAGCCVVSMPLSESMPWSSWFWNISRMMSQPPMNSPLM